MKIMIDLQSEPVKTAIEMFKNGVSVSRIADKIGKSSVTVYNWLTSAGLRQKNRTNLRKYSKSQKQKALEMYQKGYTLKQISEEIGAAKMTIYNWIMRSDVELRKRTYSQKYTKETVENAVKLYQNGMTMEQIAAEIGCCIFAVRCWIDKADVPFRRSADYNRTRFGEKDKVRAVELFRNGKSYTEIAAEIGCSVTTARKWVINNRL